MQPRHALLSQHRLALQAATRPDALVAAQCILMHLPFKDVAALSATCRSTHTLIVQQPRMFWAALARAQYAAGHPVHESHDKLGYHREQRALHDSIAQGRPRKRDFELPPGALLPCTLAVAAANSRQPPNSALCMCRCPES